MATLQADRHQRPELTELQSVSAGGWGLVAVFALVALVLSAFVGMILGTVYAAARWRITHHWPDRAEMIPVVGCIALVAAILGVRRALREYSFWTTDREGITAKAVLRTLYIPWFEVTSASVARSRTGEQHIVLSATRGAIWIPASQKGSQLLGASIWQHLGRYGKADDSLLLPGTEALWARIPDEVPIEMDWHNPKPQNWSLAAAALMVLLLVAALVWLVFRFGEKHAYPISHSFYVIAAGIYAAAKVRLFAVTRCHIRSDRFEARTSLGQVCLMWTDLVRVTCDDKSITLRGKDPRTTAMIPFSVEDKESVFAVLAIVRHARRAGHAVLLPDSLVMSGFLESVAAPPEPGPGESVELRVPRRMLAISAAATVLPALVFLWAYWVLPMPRWVPWAIVGWVALATLSLAALRATVARVDQEGVTSRSLFRCKRVLWREVASYSVKTVSAGGRHVAFWVLKDSSGRALISLTPLTGHGEDRRRFAAYLEAKLAGIRREIG